MIHSPHNRKSYGHEDQCWAPALPDLPPTRRNTDKKAWSRAPCLCGWYTNLHLYQTDQSTCSRHRGSKVGKLPSSTVYCVIVPVPNEPVGNLGAVFDPNMNMSAHVSKVIKSANYHLRNIEKIRKFRNTDTTNSAIVSLVTSRLDYRNRLLCGITDELLCRLQKVQNNAARVVSGSKKYDHITPVLKDLDWLPIRKRIELKILLLTFKYMQGCTPLYLRELLVKQGNTRTLRSNPKNLLQIPPTLRNTDKKAWSRTPCLCGWYTTLHLYHSACSRHRGSKVGKLPSITVYGEIVPVLHEPVCNIGAVFDPNMNMSAHVTKVITSANYHLRNIDKK